MITVNSSVASILKSCLVTIAAMPIFSMPGYAAEHVHKCPEYVSATSASAEAPASWKVFSQPNKLKAVSAGFSDGPPSDVAYLKPNETRRVGRREIVIWKFEGPYQNGKWLSCDYEGRVVSLAKEIPEETSRCEIEYVGLKAGGVSVGPIRCQ